MKMEEFLDALDEALCEVCDGCERDENGERVLCGACQAAREAGRQVAHLPD